MRRILLFVLIAAASRTQTPLLVSDHQTTQIKHPPGFKAVRDIAMNNVLPDFSGYGAQWLWLNRTDRPYGVNATFQTGFMSNCPDAPTSLRIGADDLFSVILNGVSICSGKNQKLYTFQIKPQCGWNNLTVTATDLSVQGRAGVIFTILQNQTNCYQCGALAFYDVDNCKCECKAKCPCENKLQKWASYPLCGCACSNRAFTTCNLRSQYFNEESCSCQCLPKRCLENLEQDPKSCECRCKSQDCAQDRVWSYSLCSCVKKVCKITSCQLPKVLDPKSCQCKCASKVACPSNSFLDNRTCRCISQHQQNINN